MEVTQSAFFEMADDTKLSEAADMLEGRAAMQWNLVWRSEQAGRQEASDLQQGWMGIKGSLERQRWGSDWLGNSSADKDLGGLVDSKVEHELEVHPGSGEVYCEVIISFSLALVKPHVAYSIQLLAAQYKKRH